MTKARYASAVLSTDAKYRYRLDRVFDTGKPALLVIGVNPSTADGTKDDATIRKCMGFATRGGFGRLIMGNVFAYRSTLISGLPTDVEEARGPENTAHIYDMLTASDRVLFAWGPLAKLKRDLRNEWSEVSVIARNMSKQPYCLGICGDGQPKHPLMLGYDTPMVPWTVPRPS